MTDSLAIVAQFQSILDVIETDAPCAATTEADPVVACGRFQSVLCETILPRRISLRAENGDRLSVVARNRRIVAVAEVHPASLWTAEGKPEDAICELDFDTFGAPLAKAVLAVTSAGSVQIESHIVTDSLPEIGLNGYPASRLTEHVERVKGDDVENPISVFLKGCGAFACARFGDDTTMTIPEGSSIHPDWLSARVANYADTVSSLKRDIRLVVREGDAPCAIACAWINGSGCIAVSDDPKRFDELEAQFIAVATPPQPKPVD